MTHIEKLRKEFDLLCDVTDEAFCDGMPTRDGMVAVLLQLDGVYNALRVVEEDDAMLNTPLWECFHALENIVESNHEAAGDKIKKQRCPFCGSDEIDAQLPWTTPLWECFYALENIVESNPDAAGDRARAALLAVWRQQGNDDVDMPESTWGSMKSHE
jgi:hypothetical protein